MLDHTLAEALGWLIGAPLWQLGLAATAVFVLVQGLRKKKPD